MKRKGIAVTLAVVGLGGFFAVGTSSTQALTVTTTPQKSGLPPPYNKAPNYSPGAISSPLVSRGTYFRDTWQLHGIAKVVRVYLVKADPMLRLVKQGTSRYNLTELGPTWVVSNLHDLFGAGAVISLRMYVSLAAKRGSQVCYDMLFKGANNKLKLNIPVHQCSKVRAHE